VPINTNIQLYPVPFCSLFQVINLLDSYPTILLFLTNNNFQGPIASLFSSTMSQSVISTPSSAPPHSGSEIFFTGLVSLMEDGEELNKEVRFLSNTNYFVTCVIPFHRPANTFEIFHSDFFAISFDESLPCKLTMFVMGSCEKYNESTCFVTGRLHPYSLEYQMLQDRTASNEGEWEGVMFPQLHIQSMQKIQM
jgi:hypothetical protein